MRLAVLLLVACLSACAAIRTGTVEGGADDSCTAGGFDMDPVEECWSDVLVPLIELVGPIVGVQVVLPR